MTKKSTTKTSKSVVKITKTDDDPEQPNVVKNTKKDTETRKESSEAPKNTAKIVANNYTIASELSRIKRKRPQAVTNTPRWYHFVALIAVLALAGFAIFKLINRFDMSLLGAAHSVDVYYGCVTSTDGKLNLDELKPRSFGLYAGDMFGKNGLTANENDAYVRIVQFEKDYVVVDRHSDDNEWAQYTIDYGTEQSVYLENDREDCANILHFTIY